MGTKQMTNVPHNIFIQVDTRGRDANLRNYGLISPNQLRKFAQPSPCDYYFMKNVIVVFQSCTCEYHTTLTLTFVPTTSPMNLMVLDRCFLLLFIFRCHLNIPFVSRLFIVSTKKHGPFHSTYKRRFPIATFTIWHNLWSEQWRGPKARTVSCWQ